MSRTRSIPLLPAWIRWTLVVLVASAILAASLGPGQTSPGSLLPDIPHVDKAAHLLGFVLLGLAVAYATTDRGPAPMMRATILYAGLVFYGAILEGLQGFRPDRLLEYGDLAANAIGGLIVFVWFKLVPADADDLGRRPGPSTPPSAR